jgi:hypothetical protein
MPTVNLNKSLPVRVHYYFTRNGHSGRRDVSSVLTAEVMIDGLHSMYGKEVWGMVYNRGQFVQTF